ncbi:MAG: hypothetical protein ACOY0T_19525 [Myxococcota bacterium]
MSNARCLRLVRPGDRGEVELGTALLRRFLGIADEEFVELTFLGRGSACLAHATNEREHVRLLKAADQQRRFTGAYQLVNGPIRTELLCRYLPNQIHKAWNGRAGDRDVALRRAVYIDIDTIRPKGISATEDEKRAAAIVRDEILRLLVAGTGTQALGLGDSGNGYFILIAIEPCVASKESEARLNAFLKLLARRYNTDEVQIDTSVGNLGRLMPCPGTWKRKGEDTPERPHRQVYFSCRPMVQRIPLESIIG